MSSNSVFVHVEAGEEIVVKHGTSEVRGGYYAVSFGNDATVFLDPADLLRLADIIAACDGRAK